MIKKILAAAIATILLASLTVTAFAAPDETTAPTDTTAPVESTAPADSTAPAPTVAPAGTSAPTDSNLFIERVKAMRAEVNALRALLKTEREYDQKVRSEIRSLQGIVKQDTETVKKYYAEAKELKNKLKDLNNQLKKALHPNDKKGEGKWDHGKRDDSKKNDGKPDEALIADLKAKILVVENDIAALKAKYQPLLDQLKNNREGRRSLKPLRELLDSKYDALKPLIREAQDLSRDVHDLMKYLKAAIEANDLTKATEIVEQILAKFELQKANINARIAIRKEMSTILDNYKAGLAQPDQQAQKSQKEENDQNEQHD